MNRLYKKNEITFAVIMIVIYVVGTGASEALAQITGTGNFAPAVFHFSFAALILFWIKRNGLMEKYGLVLPKYNVAKAWFYLPLAIVACSCLAFGIVIRFSPLETVLYLTSMITVGFLEEILFRGFLFVGIAKENLRNAIIVSSLTFGIGHITNLLNGQPLLETLMQIAFAVSVGFALVAIFYKGKSLIPCIVFHAVNNSLSAFEKTNAEIAASYSMSEEQFEMILVAVFIVLMAVYSIGMYKKLEVKTQES